MDRKYRNNLFKIFVTKDWETTGIYTRMVRFMDTNNETYTFDENVIILQNGYYDTSTYDHNWVSAKTLKRPDWQWTFEQALADVETQKDAKIHDLQDRIASLGRTINIIQTLIPIERSDPTIDIKLAPKWKALPDGCAAQCDRFDKIEEDKNTFKRELKIRNLEAELLKLKGEGS